MENRTFPMRKAAKRMLCILASALLILATVGCASKQEIPPALLAPVSAKAADLNTHGIGPLYTEADTQKFCIAVLPTGLSQSVYSVFYIIPQNQETLYTAYRKGQQACTNAEEALSAGWALMYQEDCWEAMADGSLRNGTQMIPAEAGAALFSLCSAAIRDVGLQESVAPRELAGIRSAALEWFGTHIITDETDLKQIEQWLVQSTQDPTALRFPAGPLCPFSALLTLELSNGETKTIAMAADDCCVWMSEGTFYSYETAEGNNHAFFRMFASGVVHDAVRQSTWDVITDIPHLFDWDRYVETYGKAEALQLLDQLASWAEEEPDHQRISTILDMHNGLDGFCLDRYRQVLVQLYEHNPAEFAQLCVGDLVLTPDPILLQILGEAWNMTPQAVENKLRADLK